LPRGLAGGDIARLQAAGIRLKPEVSATEQMAQTARAAGAQVAAAAGRPDVALAAETVARAISKAVSDTATAVTALGGAADAQGTGLQAATGS
jgi:hypothetical protein